MKINKNGKIFTIKVDKQINSFRKGGLRKSYQDGGKTNITYNGNKYVWDRDSDKFYDTNGAEVTDFTFVSNLNNYLLEKGIAAPSIEKEVSKIAIDLNNNEVAFNLNRDFKYDYIYNKDNDTFSFKDKKSNKGYKLLVNNPEADKKLRDRLKELDYDKSVSNLELSTEQDKENTSTKTNTSAFPELGIIDESIRDLDTYTEKIESPNLNTKEQEDKKLEVKKTESTTDNKNIETGKVFNLPGDNTYTYMTKDGKFYYNSSSNKDWTEVTKKEAISKLQDYLDGKTSTSSKSKISNNTNKAFQNSNPNSNKINKNIPDYTGGAIFKARGETIMSKEGDYYYIDGNKWSKITDAKWLVELKKNTPKKAQRWKGYNQDMENLRLEKIEIEKARKQGLKEQGNLSKEDIEKAQNISNQLEIKRRNEETKEKRIRELSQGRTRQDGEKDYVNIINIQKTKQTSYEEAKELYNKIYDQLKKIQIDNNLDTIEQAKTIYYKQPDAIKFKKGGTNNIMKTYKINNKVYTIKSK